MAFNFTNAINPELSKSPIGDIVGNILGGYASSVGAKYLPREKEADIFHKQIAPLAMLASSPFFLRLINRNKIRLWPILVKC